MCNNKAAKRVGDGESTGRSQRVEYVNGILFAHFSISRIFWFRLKFRINYIKRKQKSFPTLIIHSTLSSTTEFDLQPLLSALKALVARPAERFKSSIESTDDSFRFLIPSP